MASKQVIEIDDGKGGQLRVEFDGSDLSASIKMAHEREAPSVDLSQDDRARLGEFLRSAHVDGRG